MKNQKKEETKLAIQEVMEDLPDEIKIALDVMKQAKIAQETSLPQEIEHAPINFSS